MRLIAVLVSCCLLASCASFRNPLPARTIEVTETIRVTPPARFLAYCEIERSEAQTLLQEIERLAALVECERADKDAIRAWSKGESL